MQSSMHQLPTKTKKFNIPPSIDKSILRPVSGPLLMSSRQLSFDLFNAPEFESFIDCCGGTADKIKSPYITLLPSNY